jgi:hypothetical protein
MRAGWRWICALVLVAACSAALAAEDGTAKVTYISGASFYVSAGREAGLAPGDHLEVERNGEVIATLSVTEATSHRAVCSIVESSDDPEVGDAVRFSPKDPQPSAPARRKLGVRGRIGLQFIAVSDATGDYGDYSQPALDLRLDGANLGGGPWGFLIDARARRTYRELSDDDSRTRIYRMLASWAGSDGRWSFVAGRQFSPALAGISIFDGLTGAYSRQRWSIGLFTGSQPDSEDFGYDGDLREHGLYFELRSDASSSRSWSLTTGLIGSYEESEVNREFLYLQGRYRGKKLLAYFAQEIDFNRDWKKDEAGESSLEPTSTLISLRYRAHDRFSLYGGFDNRRNVRLLRDRETPVTEFDDEFRQGYWAGAATRFSNHLSLAVDGRFRSGDEAGDSEAYSARFGASRLTRRNLGLHLRSSRYSNPRVEGWLYAFDAGLDLGSRVYLVVEAGLRDESSEISGFFDDSLVWASVEVDVSIGRRWYLLAALERISGDLEDYGQLFTRLSYRF